MHLLSALFVFSLLLVGTFGQQCGNGICDGGETSASCPADCVTVLCNGNGICEQGETPSGCPADCQSVLCNGNGLCEDGETPSSCPIDCMVETCNNNGICEPGESSTSCSFDCGAGAFCGNLICEASETAETCPADCQGPPTFCGNGICEASETPTSCPGDCPSGSSTTGSVGDVCGDGLCGSSESYSSCPSDCSFCGNGFCENDETSSSCPQDCGGAPPGCGNGLCETNENHFNCPQDCPSLCGNRVCDIGETSSNCPQDCGPLTTGTTGIPFTTGTTGRTTGTTGVFSTTGFPATTGTTGFFTTGTTATTGTTGTGGSTGTTGCLPDCFGKICGSDGCGGTCGVCASGLFCHSNGAVCVGGSSVVGVVYDALTGLAVNDLECLLWNDEQSYTVVTDLNGQYKMANVTPDIYTLTCPPAVSSITPPPVNNRRYLPASIQVTVEVSSTDVRMPSLYLVRNPCLTSPACSGHGVCASDGFTCVCNEGLGGYNCSESLLPAQCTPYHGFTEEQANSVLIESAINKAIQKLMYLRENLMTVSSLLPEYESNSCCYSSTSHNDTAPNHMINEKYDLDLDLISSLTYTFIDTLAGYDADNEIFYNDLRTK